MPSWISKAPITSRREDWHVTRMVAMDRAALSRALSQESGSVARQEVSTRTVRRRLQQHRLSTRRPCLRFCLQHQDSYIHVWRHHRKQTSAAYFRSFHTGPSPGVMVWGAIRYKSRSPLVHIDVTSPICVLCDTGQDMTAAHLDECSALNDLNCIRCKQALADAALLAHHSPSAPLALHVDASDNAIGGALHQVVDSEQQPLAFFSRKLTSSEKSGICKIK
ncbi:transposable element Tcb1 transposase [Trichonephila clavipes]|nr:transposable element Tcb1 transposase [Trichonephila clavipes]